MTIKSQKLEQRILTTIDTVQEFAQTNVHFSGIIYELEAILRSLHSGRLKIQIVGGNQSILTDWQTILDQATVADHYEVHQATLPEVSDRSSSGHSLLDCDLLCLVVQQQSHFTVSEIALLEQIKNSPIVQTVIFVEMSEDLDSQASTLTALSTWLKTHFSHSAAIVVPFLFEPDQALSQPELAKLGDMLSTFTGRKAEDLLVKRLTSQFQQQLAEIEPFLMTESNNLQQEIHQAETTIQTLKQNSDEQTIKEKVKAGMTQITQEQEQFFKQVKLELSQSKAALLDEYDRHSLIHKIQAFADQLQPQIVRRKNAKYLQLQTETAQGSADINADMMHLCYSHLGQWAIDEWRRIYTSYGNGGVGHFFQRIYSILSFISIPHLSVTQPQPNSAQFQLSIALKSSVAGITCETYYREVFIGNYILRQIRNQWMGMMFLLTFLTMIGLNQGKNKRELVKSLFEPLFALRQSPILLFIILAGILCSIFLLLFYNYFNDTEFKIGDEAEKLKKQLVNHYQGFAKQAINKLIQDFFIALDAEEERLRQLLIYVDEQVIMTTIKSTHKLQLAESHLVELYNRQKKLNKTLADFEKLKRL